MADITRRFMRVIALAIFTGIACGVLLTTRPFRNVGDFAMSGVEVNIVMSGTGGVSAQGSADGARGETSVTVQSVNGGSGVAVVNVMTSLYGASSNLVTSWLRGATTRVLSRPLRTHRFILGIPAEGPTGGFYSMVDYVKVTKYLDRVLILLPLDAGASDTTADGDVGAGENNGRVARSSPAAERFVPFEKVFDAVQLSRNAWAPDLIPFPSFMHYWESDVVDTLWVEGVHDADARWAVYKNDVLRPTTKLQRAIRPAEGKRLGCAPRHIASDLGLDEGRWVVVGMSYCTANDGSFRELATFEKRGGTRWRDEHLKIVRNLPHAAHVRDAAAAFLNKYLPSPSDNFIAVRWDSGIRSRCADEGGDCIDGVTFGDISQFRSLVDVVDSAVLASHGLRSRDPSGTPAGDWPIFLSTETADVSDAAVAALVERGYYKVVRYAQPAGVSKADEFVSTLVQQEIALRATAFVGTESLWSLKVMDSRVADRRKSVSLWTRHALTPSYNETVVSAVEREGIACGYEYMGISDEPPRVMSIACTSGKRMTQVLFSSFGTPTGLCGAFERDPTCDSMASVQYVRRLCIGKARCDIPVSNSDAHFAVLCEGRPALALAVTMLCE